MSIKYLTLASFCNSLNEIEHNAFWKTPSSFYENVFDYNNQILLDENLTGIDNTKKIKTTKLKSKVLDGLKDLTFHLERKQTDFTKNLLLLETIKLVVLYKNTKFANIELAFSSIYKKPDTRDFITCCNFIKELLPAQKQTDKYTNIQLLVVLSLCCFFRNDGHEGDIDTGYTVEALISILESNSALDYFKNNFPKYKPTAQSNKLTGPFNSAYIIKTLIKLYLIGDDSQSKEKSSIYRSEKYIPDSVEEQKTREDYDDAFTKRTIKNREIISFFNMFDKIVNEDFEVSDELISQLYKIKSRYPEEKILQEYLDTIEKQRKDKGNEHSNRH